MDHLLPRKKVYFGNRAYDKQQLSEYIFPPTLHKIRQYHRLPLVERPLAVWDNENPLRDSSCKAELQRLSGSIHD